MAERRHDPAGVSGLVEDLPGLHIDVAADDADEDAPGTIDRYEQLEALIDAFVECFNARDLEGAVGLLANDVELPGLGGDDPSTALVRCWEARPNALLTRGVLTDEADTDGWWTQPVAVQWDLGGDGTWQRSALLSFDHDDSSDGGSLGLVEYVGDVAVLDDATADPPDGEGAEGGRWSLWEEGAD